MERPSDLVVEVDLDRAAPTLAHPCTHHPTNSTGTGVSGASDTSSPRRSIEGPPRYSDSTWRDT